jgi:hypothetical protein
MQNAIEHVTQRGWKIFPLIPRSRFATDQPLRSEATSSIAQIEEWKKRYLDCQWALATGEQSGVFVVECSLDLGVQTLRSHCDDEFALMDTLQILTPKRVALIFGWPDAGIPDCRREMLAQGIYVRKSGGYFELPLGGEGSRAFSDLSASVKQAPPWLLNLVKSGLSNHETAEVCPFPAFSRSTLIVGMAFALVNRRWICDFVLLKDGGASIIKTQYFRSSSTIFAMAERGGVAMNPTNREWICKNIQNGRGNMILNLTREQYQKLLAA